MKKLNFASDYMQGCLSAIMDRLSETNLEYSDGYGEDEYCRHAGELIREACGCRKALVRFLVGGTQTNATMIDALLHNYEGVIACDTGHIEVHEAGAIEASNHKVLLVKGKDGKLAAEDLAQYMHVFHKDGNKDHMVQPDMVYISQPTEYGTLYSLEELKALSKVCRKYHLHLYADGARLAYALGSEDNDVTLKDLAKYCDAFYIGGTKCGTMFGEAVVVPDPSLIPHFITTIKQHGALFAKGRILGVQFEEMFREGLYFEAGKKAVAYSKKIAKAFEDNGYQLYLPCTTNQIFVVMENQVMKKMQRKASISFFETVDESHTLVRLATSWGTEEEDVNALIKLIEQVRP